MEHILSSFKANTDEIKKHIAHLEEERNNPDYQDYDPPLYVTSFAKRKFDYRSLIISIYGILENYIEELIKAYLEELESEINDYKQVKKKIQDTHFANSITLVSRIIENKHLKYNRLNKDDVLLNLNNCIQSGNLFQFNKEAFTILSGNLKHIKICNLINELDINLDASLRKLDIYKESANSENIFNPIDELVERRNEIAHNNNDNILAISRVLKILEFMETYCNEIYNILKTDLDEQILIFRKKKQQK